MGAVERIFAIGIFVGTGWFSWWCFDYHFRQPAINDVGLITQSAENFGETLAFMDKQGESYLTRENDTLPLAYALDRMEIVRQDNPDKAQDIGRLISQIEAVKGSEATIADPLLYRTALSGLKTDLSGYAGTNRDGEYILLGGLTALSSLVGLGAAVYDFIEN